MNTIPEHGGTSHNPSETPIITTERHDVTDKVAPITAPAPEAFDIQEHVLDHAGALYDWFDRASVNKVSGNLQIVAAADTAEYLIDYNDPRSSRLREFTPDQVWAVILKEHEDWKKINVSNYTARYFADLVAERFDDVDGDMNVIDEILQQLAFGESVFG